MEIFLKLLAVLCVTILASATIARKRVKRIVGGRPAAVPPEDDPVVFVYLDDHDAKIYGSRDRPDGFYRFHGIRYAEPPVGRFRFQRPQKLRPTGEINATIPGPPCPQPDPKNEKKIIGSEDCLYLNVFTPSLPDGSDGLPVLMWIHGGGYRRGSASQYGVRHLVTRRLVVVTIQYRLGSLGFLSASSKELPGNAGMFDMTLALEWIRDYITFFGGNPNKITVCGQGTGASSAVLLSLSQFTQGWLSGVLAMSGSALSAFAIDHNPLATGRALAKQNGCPESPVLEMVKCLQELPVSTLIQADSGWQELRLAAQGVLAGITGILGPAPCIEGGNDDRFLPNYFEESPLSVLQAGKFPKIPLMTGVTRDETAPAFYGKYRTHILENLRNSPDFLNQVLSNIVANSNLFGNIFNRTDELVQNVANKYFQVFQGDSDSILKQFVEATGDALFNLPAFQMAKLWSKHTGRAFFYSFEQISKKKKHGGWEFLHGLPLVEDDSQLGAHEEVGHGDDLPYIFDPEPLYGNISSGNLVFKDPEDEKVQNITTHLIAEFARSGKPTISGDGVQPSWPTFSEETNDYVTISSRPSPHDHFRLCQMALWGGTVSRLQSTTCERFWGTTKFSEDTIAFLNRNLEEGLGQGAIINTVINNTLTGNIAGGALANTVFNKTLPLENSIPISNGTLINNALGNPLTQVGSGILNPVVKPGILLPGENVQTAGIPETDTSTNGDIEENVIIPVTESKRKSTAAPKKHDLIPGLLPNPFLG